MQYLYLYTILNKCCYLLLICFSESCKHHLLLCNLFSFSLSVKSCAVCNQLLDQPFTVITALKIVRYDFSMQNDDHKMQEN